MVLTRPPFLDASSFSLQTEKIQKVVNDSISLSSSPLQSIPLHHVVASIGFNVCHHSHVHPNSI
jgi:hypothetical protein